MDVPAIGCFHAVAGHPTATEVLTSVPRTLSRSAMRFLLYPMPS